MEKGVSVDIVEPHLPGEHSLAPKLRTELKLMALHQQGDLDWSRRYAKKFGDFYNNNKSFKELVIRAGAAQEQKELKVLLDRIQKILNNPTLLDT